MLNNRWRYPVLNDIGFDRPVNGIFASTRCNRRAHNKPAILVFNPAVQQLQFALMTLYYKTQFIGFWRNRETFSCGKWRRFCAVIVQRNQTFQFAGLYNLRIGSSAIGNTYAIGLPWENAGGIVHVPGFAKQIGRIEFQL